MISGTDQDSVKGIQVEGLPRLIGKLNLMYYQLELTDFKYAVIFSELVS